MREILFRGKNIGNGEWVEGSLVTRRYNDTGEVFEAFIVVDAYPQTGVMNFGTTPVLISPSDGLCYRVDKDTICQYTGLTDKNGQKIWENDILRGNNDDRDLVKVVFGEFGVIDASSLEAVDNVIGLHYEVLPTDHLSRTEPFCLSMPLTSTYVNRGKYEVIGNVFDNAELLKE